MIPEPLYKQILENIPICCVDLVVFHQGKILLVKRNTEPAKNEWWIPGGRLLKKEKILDAVHRKAEQEIGLSVKIDRFLDCYETIFEKGPFGIESGTHSINMTFVVVPDPEDQVIDIDNTIDEHKWSDGSEVFHHYLQRVLNDFELTQVISEKRRQDGQ